MTASLSNDGSSAHLADSFEERIRGLSRQELADRLQWLSWYQPGVFTAVMDYMDFCDTLAADTGPASSRLDPDGPACGEEPVPVCGRCGADIGIFIRFGLEYRHYREGASLGEAEIFDPGHPPELVWRTPAPTPAGA
jgi:hypothetical protein